MLDTATDPLALFDAWFADAQAAEVNDPNAMAVASVGTDGRPSQRMVLLKGHGPQGFVFYTNTHSRKGAEIIAHPAVALLFHWKSLRRQIRIEGDAATIPDDEADAYFATRPRESQLGAWASDQSRPLASRALFEARLADVSARFEGGPVPRPPHWTGFRVTPHGFEYWQDVAYRLHDRITFVRDDQGGWTRGRLFP